MLTNIVQKFRTEETAWQRASDIRIEFPDPLFHCIEKNLNFRMGTQPMVPAPLLGGAFRNCVDWHPEVLQNIGEVDLVLTELY